jgi:hypothetical protein
MSKIQRIFDHLALSLYSIKDKNLEWQKNNQDQQIQLSHQRILAEKNLAAELAKKSVQLVHEIDLLKTHQQAELTKAKTRCKEDLKDYQQYLESLNQFKQILKTSYAHLPDAIALTIHHHAKSLLNSMWEAESLEEKIGYETRLIEFIKTLHQEAGLCSTEIPTNRLPEKTLKLISQDKNSSLLH